MPDFYGAPPCVFDVTCQPPLLFLTLNVWYHCFGVDQAYDGVKVDVFTGGAMLFILLTGLPPFTAATRADANFKRIVWRGDVQGLLTSWRVPTLSAEVRLTAWNGVVWYD